MSRDTNRVEIWNQDDIRRQIKPVLMLLLPYKYLSRDIRLFYLAQFIGQESTEGPSVRWALKPVLVSIFVFKWLKSKAAKPMSVIIFQQKI